MKIVINGDHKACLIHLPFAVKFYERVAQQGKVQAFMPLPTQREVSGQQQGDAEGFVYVNTEKEILIIRTRKGVVVMAGYLEIANALSELISTAATARANIGLGNVNNTSDANKPVSTAQQTALDLKANVASPTFTGTVNGITAAMVGLGNVNNTTDAGKPISTATQTALNLKLDASTLPTITSANAGQSLIINAEGTAYVADVSARGFRNKLINGDFQVWQRGTTFTDPDNINLYTADRWAVFRNSYAAGLTVTQQSVQTNSKSIRVQRTAGNALLDYIALAQSLETIEVKKLVGKTVTLQFKALKGANFSESTNNLTAQIIYGTGTDGNTASGFAVQTAIATLSAPLTTTNTLFSLTTTLPSNATQLAVQFSYTPVSTALTNDYFEITDVQLEEGAVATPFERRSYGLELALCQRYFFSFGGSSSFEAVGSGSSNTTSLAYINVSLPVKMRISPAVTYSAVGDWQVNQGAVTSTVTALSLAAASPINPKLSVTCSAVLTPGFAAHLSANATQNARLNFSAEL